jgi:hypothetical protein
MNPNNNINTSPRKDPYLKLRYARGGGDLVACILHSKPVGWLTYLITGKKEPCKQCSQRRNALNIVFPIQFWKLFFKDQKALVQSLSKELIDYGYRVSVSADGKNISSTKIQLSGVDTPISNFDKKPETPATIPVNTTKTFNKPNVLDNYTIISTNDVKSGDFLIKTVILKKK